MISNIDNYFKYYLKELELTNKSKNTITTYKTIMHSFKDFLNDYEKHVTEENLKKIDILTFLEYKTNTMNKQGDFSNKSKQLYITFLKSFFKFINENFDKNMEINEIFNFKIQNPKRTPKGIEAEDLEKIKNHLSTLDLTDFNNLRQSMLLKILIYSGCRCAELREITVDSFIDINDDLFNINVIGKGSKERSLYVPKQIIINELNMYKQLDIQYIAISKNKKRLDNSQIWRLLNTVFKTLGLNYSGVHIFRHTFAKTMLHKGTSINIVKELMGHSSITTTSIYTNPSKKDIEKAYTAQII